MAILVTGGCGYIGSLTALRLHGRDVPVWILDNLSRSAAYPALRPIEQIVCDITQGDELQRVLAGQAFEAVLHFASLIEVPESVEHPYDYIAVNVLGTGQLLRAMTRSGVKKLIFSSSAAVYGIPKTLPIDETSPCHPINPYGATKKAAEDLIQEWVEETGSSAVALRYFNACGSSRNGEIWEAHRPHEIHLLPNLIQSALSSPSETRPFHLYGTDYATPDGTAIRDFIHIEDLVQAHLLALDALQPGRFEVYNVGSGKGHSIQECIQAVEQIGGHKVQVVSDPRRPGDPPELVASTTRIRADLGWKPTYTLQGIIESILANPPVL